MSIVAYLKPTNFCSVGCDHCYLSDEILSNKLVMSDETLINSLELIKKIAIKENTNEIEIIWHGGEPMMVRPSWFWNANRIISESLSEFKHIQSIQTSLLPYNKKWDELISKVFDSHIGSSIDFSSRIIESSDKYQSTWLRKVDLARKKGHYVSPLMVPSINEVGQGKEIVDWFANHDFDRFGIEKFSAAGETKPISYTSNRAHSRFLIEVFDRTLERLKLNLKTPQINTVSAGVMGVIFGLPGDRWGGSCQRSFIVIEPNGDTNTCPDRVSFEKPFSNVMDKDETFFRSKERRNWIKIQTISHKEPHCSECEYNYWCKSGCPITPNSPSKEGDCSGFKTYLEHIKEVLALESNKDLMLKHIHKGVVR